MKKTRFQKLLRDQSAALVALTATKGDEYANSDDDQLANFRRLSQELGLPIEKILSVYLTKHMDSIKFYIKNVGATPDTGVSTFSEPIEGRIDDAILYLVLLKAMVIEKNEGGMGP